MSYKQNEANLFKSVNRTISTTEKELKEVYQAIKTNIETRIKEINAKGNTAKFTLARLENLYKQINIELTQLKNDSRKIIQAGYIKTFDDAYYGTAFNYSEWVNTVATNLTNKHYNLGFFRIDRNFIIASLNERVAGEGLLDRLGKQSAILQSELRTAIANATTQGISVKETAKNLERGSQLLKSATEKALNHSATIAHTELLKAYSIGNELATNQAEAAGVVMKPTWDASLDGNTRPSHGEADGKEFNIAQNGEYVLRVGGILFLSPRIPADGQTNTAKEVIRCRCRKQNNPYGFEPTTRVAKLQDGTWKQVSGDLSYTQWSKTLEGRASIEGALQDRKNRALKLRLDRNKKTGG